MYRISWTITRDIPDYAKAGERHNIQMTVASVAIETFRRWNQNKDYRENITLEEYYDGTWHAMTIS